MLTFENELDKKRREFGKAFVFTILGIFLFYNILNYVLGILYAYNTTLPKKTLLVSFIGIGYVAFLISKTSFNFWSIYKIITGSLFALILYFSLYLCHKSMIICLFYIPIILMILMLTSPKIAFLCTFLILLLCFFTPEISLSLNFAQPTTLTPLNYQILHAQEYIVMFFSALISLVILFYQNEFNKIELRHLRTKTESADLEIQNEEPQEIAEEKFDRLDELYNEIIIYMEDKKPYQDSEFSIKKLSKALNTNETYVSRALNQKGNKKFNILVNQYRIAQVKTELLKDINRRYSLEHLYTKAGFTQQSTFNRVFKEDTGITPSQYIFDLTKKK